MQRGGEHPDRRDAVLDGRELLGRMATAVLAAGEHHRRLRDLRDVLGVVTCATVHPAKRDPLLRRGTLQRGDDLRVRGGRREIERLRPRDLEAAPLGDLAHQLLLVRMLGVDRRLVGMA